MSIREHILRAWGDSKQAFLVSDLDHLSVSDLVEPEGLSEIRPGDVVALIGDFDADTISAFLYLIDLGALIAPLTSSTRPQHPYFFEACSADFIVEHGRAQRVSSGPTTSVLEEFRTRGNPGLILFSSGTTGNPKAILHDFTSFIERYKTPRPALRTLSFLLFDHIGGINTLFHTLFNRGVVISPRDRGVHQVLEQCSEHKVELLPTTPTFLRMLLFQLDDGEELPESLRIITYGTERMDELTLGALVARFPQVEFRQTYGMSELGILRVRSRSRTSLWIEIGGEGIEAKVVNDALHLKSSSRMVGYLNAPSPFDSRGWYNTGDIVETDGPYIKIVGRKDDVVNVGGLKFLTSDVEKVALGLKGVLLASATKHENPITGNHLELLVEATEDSSLDTISVKRYIRDNLPRHMIPHKIIMGKVPISPRFKRL